MLQIEVLSKCVVVVEVAAAFAWVSGPNERVC